MKTTVTKRFVCLYFKKKEHKNKIKLLGIT